MPQDSYREIHGPDGPIHFPASMSDTDVEGAMRKLYPPKPVTLNTKRGGSSGTMPPASNQYQAIPGSDSPQAQSQRIENMYAAAGQAVPQSAMPGLAGAKKYLVDPFDKAARAGAETFADLGQAAVGLPSWFSTKGLTEQQAFEQAPQKQPNITGIARGVGGVVGGTATDPRNWPFFASSAARPLLQKAISGGFGVQMGAGTISTAKDLHDNWDKLTPAQRAEQATSAGISGLMSAGALIHASTPHETSPAPDMAKPAEEASSATAPSPAKSLPPPPPTTPTGEPVLSAATPKVDVPKIDDPTLRAAKLALENRIKEIQTKYPVKPIEPVRDPFLAQPRATLESPESIDARAKEVFAKSDSVGKGESQWFAKAKDALFPGKRDLSVAEIGKVSVRAKEMLAAWQEPQRGALSFRPIAHGGPSPAESIANVIDRFLPKTSVVEEVARTTIREFAAEKRLRQLQINERYKNMVKAHDSDGATELRAFMDAGEGKPGAQFLRPEDQVVAEDFHKQFQERWEKVKEVTGAEGGIENYLSHLWEKPGAGKRLWNQIMGKRPIEGPKGFLKHRVYDYLSEGMDSKYDEAGNLIRGPLKPITYNPIRMQMMALEQVDKFLAAHELKDRFKETGQVQWVGLGSKPPEGWHTLNDKIFQPSVMKDVVDTGVSSVQGGKGLVRYGQYYAHPDLAKIFNRYVSPGLRGNAYYDSLRTYGNTLNMMNLGLSAYHGSFITITSAISDVALGLQQFTRGDFKGGAKEFLRGTLGNAFAASAVDNYKLGKAIQEAAIKGTSDPRLAQLSKDIVKAGGTFAQDPFYEQRFAKGLKQMVYDKEFIQLGERGIQNFPITKAIMQKFVPRVKLGMFAKMAEAKLEHMEKQGTADDFNTRVELAKIWDSVDNRAGQMVYDNLFWNKVAKDTSFLVVRAVGWDHGSLREFGGAIGLDVPRQAVKLLRGQRPELTPRMAFTIATPIVVGLLGAITTYLATGKAPQQTEDYFFPPSGRMGTNGKPERISYPSYMKDAYSFYNAPGRTAINKLHPAWNQAFEFFTNRDYYNQEVYGPGDIWYKQGLDVLKWYGKTYVPFTMRMAAQRQSQGIPSREAIAESFVGIQHAPSYVTSSKAEELASELARRHWQAGPMTSEDIDRRNTYGLLRSKLAQNKLVKADLDTAIKSGKLRLDDIDRLFEDRDLSPLQADFKRVPLGQALRIMAVADASERAQLKPVLLDKLDELDNMTPDQQAEILKKVKPYLQ